MSEALPDVFTFLLGGLAAVVGFFLVRKFQNDDSVHGKVIDLDKELASQASKLEMLIKLVEEVAKDAKSSSVRSGMISDVLERLGSLHKSVDKAHTRIDDLQRRVS